MNYFDNHLNFSQRNGYEALPEPMQLNHISNDLRLEVCNVISDFLLKIHVNTNIYGQFPDYNDYLLRQNHYNKKSRDEKDFVACVLSKSTKVTHQHMRDKINKETSFINFFEEIVLNEEFNKVLDLLENLISEIQNKYSQHFHEFITKISGLFDKYSAAYQLNINDSPIKFFIRISKEQENVTCEAVETLCQRNFNLATKFLHEAKEHIKNGHYAPSIRSSFNALESVACEIDPKSKKTLGKAIESLGKKCVLESSMTNFMVKELQRYANSTGRRQGGAEENAVDTTLIDALEFYGYCVICSASLIQRCCHE